MQTFAHSFAGRVCSYSCYIFRSALSESREEDEDSSSSSTTSTFDSNNKLSSLADVQVCNELNLLRMIDNRQKEKILMLTSQKKELEQEVERVKKLAGETR